VLVMDPPFGGRVEPLAKTVLEIMQLHRKLCPNIHTDMLGMFIFIVELLENKFLLNFTTLQLHRIKCWTCNC
jgi:hypothetical protein